MSARTLVAGIGNVFFGDDGFGVEVARRLLERPVREGVSVVEFGIRGIDLGYALVNYDRAILIDALPRGGAPGTLYVIEPDLAALAHHPAAMGSGHDVLPEHALCMAQRLGAALRHVRVVGCEPGFLPQEHELSVGLSPPVAAAVVSAVALVEELLEATHA